VVLMLMMIQVWDSMGLERGNIGRNIAGTVNRWIHHHTGTEGAIRYTETRGRLPRQPDGFNCGLFVLLFMLCFIDMAKQGDGLGQLPSFSCSHEALTRYRLQLSAAIMNRQEVVALVIRPITLITSAPTIWL